MIFFSARAMLVLLLDRNGLYKADCYERHTDF